MSLTDLERQLEAILTQHDEGTDGSHDLHHARRVKINASEIVVREGAGDMRLLTAAAYLHDLVNVPKDSAQRSEASRLSAEAAGPLLQDLGFSESETEAIQHCIIAHSFSAKIAPETLEAKILQDADRMEALGALGIARTFYVGGKLNSSLFDGDDPFAGNRELDDSNFAVDHFKTKLLGLADTMQTSAGREVAEQRTEFMRHYLDQLASEIGGTNA
ncbi:MAG: HD domain-containing protein, partial [Verrucomicrobiales bacterium]